MSRNRLILLAALVFWVLSGCSTNDRIAGPVPGEVALTCQGLEGLGPDYVYEGWLAAGDEMISVGTFTVDAAGGLSPSEFEVSEDDLWSAERFVVTIEPAADGDSLPSKTHVLAGDFGVTGAVSDDALLSPEHPDALGDDFSGVYGGYMLETPTTADQTDDYANGVWFGIPGMPPHWGTLLSLRALPDGWRYEGWVVTPDSAVSTGRFRFVSSADSDGPGPAAGPDAGPEYPGQDFIDPAMTLPGYDLLITIEPEPDNSPGPFSMRVLVDTVIVDKGAFHIEWMESRIAGSFPSGRASR